MLRLDAIVVFWFFLVKADGRVGGRKLDAKRNLRPPAFFMSSRRRRYMKRVETLRRREGRLQRVQI